MHTIRSSRHPLVLVLALATGLLLALTGSAAAHPGHDAGSTGGRPLAASLTPGAEVAPFVGVMGASGQVSLRLNPGQERVCVNLRTDGFDLVLAHIHEAPVGANGPVVVDFTGLIRGDMARGCVPVERDLVRDLIRNPGDYYVNVHQGLPGDEGFFQGIRGQLHR